MRNPDRLPGYRLGTRSLVRFGMAVFLGPLAAMFAGAQDNPDPLISVSNENAHALESDQVHQDQNQSTRKKDKFHFEFQWKKQEQQGVSSLAESDLVKLQQKIEEKVNLGPIPMGKTLVGHALKDVLTFSFLVKNVRYIGCDHPKLMVQLYAKGFRRVYHAKGGKTAGNHIKYEEFKGKTIRATEFFGRKLLVDGKQYNLTLQIDRTRLGWSDKQIIKAQGKRKKVAANFDDFFRCSLGPVEIEEILPATPTPQPTFVPTPDPDVEKSDKEEELRQCVDEFNWLFSRLGLPESPCEELITRKVPGKPSQSTNVLPVYRKGRTPCPSCAVVKPCHPSSYRKAVPQKPQGTASDGTHYQVWVGGQWLEITEEEYLRVEASRTKSQ